MSKSIKSLWEAFDKWLEDNWKEAFEQLNSPAIPEQIQQLQSKLGVELPAEFIECLQVHNGERNSCGLFDGSEFLSSDEIVFQWGIWQDLLSKGEFEDIYSDPGKGVKNDWWNPKWIPFTHTGSGDHLCIDLGPSEDGTYGQIISMWHDDPSREVIAPSFRTYFEKYVKGVLDGEYVHSELYGGLINSKDI